MRNFTPRRRLTGGIRLPAHKTESTVRPIRRGLLPPRLVISTRQHRGPAAVPVVDIGEVVLRGQTIASANFTDGADIHAPTSGTVVAIESHATPLSAAITTEACIVIETDGTHRDLPTQGPVEPAATVQERLDQLSAAGIVGLGGAVYPTAAKARPEPGTPCELLIINGAECEPYISCDDLLMRESPEEILDGSRILAELVGASACIIAIERDKPQAIEAMTAAADKLAFPGFSVAELPSVYPAGGERQLVEVLVGKEIASGRYPGDAGCLCQNVGTAHAVHRYFRHGEPLTTRIVTVTGSGITEPCNVEAMIGTPIADLVAACGGYRDKPARLIHGGSMMGYAIPDDALPVTKATNCIIAADAAEIAAPDQEWPCIRCGECAIACPARLQPQDLLLAARSHDAPGLEQLSIRECIECGCCDVVCPSHIPLTRVFRGAKTTVGAFGELQALSEASDRRFQSREQRRETTTSAETRRREIIKRALSSDEQRRATIEAAVERARQRKETPVDDG
jgi:electron transport complex protein RnfC